jgi:hypothetical protein
MVHPLFHPLWSETSGSRWKPVVARCWSSLKFSTHYRSLGRLPKLNVAGSSPVSRSEALETTQVRRGLFSCRSFERATVLDEASDAQGVPAEQANRRGESPDLLSDEPPPGRHPPGVTRARTCSSGRRTSPAGLRRSSHSHLVVAPRHPAMPPGRARPGREPSTIKAPPTGGADEAGVWRQGVAKGRSCIMLTSAPVPDNVRSSGRGGG